MDDLELGLLAELERIDGVLAADVRRDIKARQDAVELADREESFEA